MKPHALVGQDPHLLGDQLRKAHHAVSYDAADRRAAGRGFQPRQQVPAERRGAMLGGGQAEHGDVLRVVGLRQAVGDGLEAKAIDAGKGVLGAGPEQATRSRHR